MLTEFKGTFRDRFEGEKEYHITEDAKENGIFEYTVFCPFSGRSTTVQSRTKLDHVACNGCLRAYQVYRPQAVEPAAHGVPAERVRPYHGALMAASDTVQSLTG